MKNHDDFAAIRDLSEDYYQQRITKEEYRIARAELLSRINHEYNSSEYTGDDPGASFVDKIISIFRKHDEDKVT